MEYLFVRSFIHLCLFHSFLYIFIPFSCLFISLCVFLSSFVCRSFFNVSSFVSLPFSFSVPSYMCLSFFMSLHVFLPFFIRFLLPSFFPSFMSLAYFLLISRVFVLSFSLNVSLLSILCTSFFVLSCVLPSSPSVVEPNQIPRDTGSVRKRHL